MIRPGEIEPFTPSELILLKRLEETTDTALRDTRGEIALRFREQNRIVPELARRYAEAGWSTELLTDHAYYLLRIRHPRISIPQEFNEHGGSMLGYADGEFNEEFVYAPTREYK